MLVSPFDRSDEANRSSVIGQEARHLAALSRQQQLLGITPGRGSGSIGLGLSIMQKIDHLHEETIEVESGPNRKTEFRLRIPDA
ncbi:ATP-binding protein [Paenibacillus koleovorans]|uniref:ATP-binding protein n=1 Tax=Paenibacillus koleovorans TaxID=121608 RepID=UPI0035A24276